MTPATAAYLVAWRARHPEATCPDATALLLAALEAEFGGASRETRSEGERT